MTKSSQVRVIATVVAVTMLLAGCTAPDEDESQQTPPPAALRVNFGSIPPSWAPGSPTESGYMRVPYETLVTLDEDYHVQPNLVTAWEEEPMSITLHLLDGVTFHDGTPFDAEAVKANLEYVRDNPGQFSGPLQAVASVETIDDVTAKVLLKFPAPTFMTILTQRNVFIASPKALAEGTVLTEPVGTGPWAYDAAASQDGVKWVFEQTDDYWGEEPGFATIELYAIEDDTAATAALLNGEIDLTDTDEAQLPLLSEGGIETLTYPAGRNNIIFFDRGPGGVFADADVRKAVCTAIDVDGLMEIEEVGMMAVPNQHFQEGDVGYNPDITGYVDPDLETAAELLNGAAVEAQFPAAPFLKQELEYLADQMNQLDGVNVTVQDLPVPEFLTSWASGRYALGVGQNNQVTPYDWYSTWYSANGFYNPAKAETPELKAAADKAIAAGDSDEADALWQDVMKIIIDDEANACAFGVFGQILAWNPEVVSGVDTPPEPYEVNLVNYRELTPSGS